jgi:hypothetical protein
VTSPFIKPRRAAFDRRFNGDDRTATIGAGEQFIVLTVSPLNEGDKDGARVDLSRANPGQPLVVTVDLSAVAVPTYNFGHRTKEPSRGPFTALECVDALARIHQLVDGQEVGGQALSDIMETLTDMGLLITDPNDNITDDLEPA